jgi:hypothetical protein
LALQADRRVEERSVELLVLRPAWVVEVSARPAAALPLGREAVLLRGRAPQQLAVRRAAGMALLRA